MVRGKMEIFKVWMIYVMTYLSFIQMPARVTKFAFCFSNNWQSLKFKYPFQGHFVSLCYRLSSSLTELSGSIFQMQLDVSVLFIFWGGFRKEQSRKTKVKFSFP